MIRVVLGEDSYLAREGIIRVLDAIEGVELVGICADLESLRAAVAESRPDVVLTDIRMPPGHADEGIRLAAELRTAHPEMGVVILWRSSRAEPIAARTCSRTASRTPTSWAARYVRSSRGARSSTRTSSTGCSATGGGGATRASRP
jgi:DNA-binding LytR/AlgR family response regulator